MKLLSFLAFLLSTIPSLSQEKITSYRVNNISQVHLYWKKPPGQHFFTFNALNEWLTTKKSKLVFAMNGGMFTPEYAPVGLYIENNKLLTKLNTVSGGGNFGLKPNGVFYITTSNKAFIVKTESFKNDSTVKYATQSGPMLLIDGTIHPAFRQGSANINIRNGVGILPDGSIIFAISDEEINFYDFALYFKNQGCKNALYLDGFVSQLYCPEKNRLQADGMFGVIIGVVEPK